ncbi:MAG: 4'-phosphopantetheinyl transferase superfamily protein [Flavobacteriales bacterium]|jgi:4'-phosphopantetheinyl transferase|nr:4'-phosphopantetheinyl transferase superfamily protein [Flavobacteriales bacterium]MBT5089587.1 4'-phosphopantetheinyl transferase superfamily protein [Flavobacteriales bacterium]MBT5749544.1 4'-phosphopantetheinyl transferase superfamily protein [Flavobacteriales bacterium]
MPIIHKIAKKNVTILVWEITEVLEELQMLEKEIYTTTHTTETRKKEFLASRLLLKEITPNTLITYNEFGAPELDNGNYISISHSKKIVAIIISEQQVGLDIEKISDKALKVSSKFVSENNLNNLNKEKATLIWCCKEAIFKLHQKGNVDFKEDIKLTPFSLQNKGIVNAEFNSEIFRLHYTKLNSHFLVYVCK